MPKGGKREGAGRGKGTPNKATQAAREAIGLFVDNNAHRLQKWLDDIAETNPEKAFNLFQSVIEYHVPKLARSEVQPLDENGEKSSGFKITVEHVKTS